MFDFVQKLCLLMAPNAFLTSTSTAASYPESCSTHSCQFPTAFVTPSFTILMGTFSAVLRSISPTQIGCKPGFLSRVTSLLAINVSSNVVLF